MFNIVILNDIFILLEIKEYEGSNNRRLLTQKVSSSLWMKDLKSVLNAYGNEPDWEIYRGDSFQL
jgi:hypothetical protein